MHNKLRQKGANLPCLPTDKSLGNAGFKFKLLKLQFRASQYKGPLNKKKT